MCFFVLHQVRAGTASRGRSLAAHAHAHAQGVQTGSVPMQGWAEVEHWGMPCPGAPLFGSRQLPAICPQGTCPSHHAAGQILLFHSNVATVFPLPKPVLTYAELAVSAGMTVDEETDKTEVISWLINVVGCWLVCIR